MDGFYMNKNSTFEVSWHQIAFRCESKSQLIVFIENFLDNIWKYYKELFYEKCRNPKWTKVPDEFKAQRPEIQHFIFDIHWPKGELWFQRLLWEYTPAEIH